MGGGALALLLSFVIFYGEDTLDFLTAVSVVYLGIFMKYVFSVPKDQRKNMMIIFFGIIAVALSGALTGHGATVFTLLMDRNVDVSLFSFEIPVTFIQAVDPLTIVVFGPLLAVLWRFMSKKGWHLSGITKTLIGFGIIVLSYKYLEVLCVSTNADHLIPVLPLIIGLSALAASDIFIYPNVLTFCSRFTPKGLTGIVMGFIVFGMSLSKLIGTYLARLASVDAEIPDINMSHSLQTYKAFFSSMTLVSLITLIVLSCSVGWAFKKKNKNGS
jgi:POT family proton-dependent oligopeptide transporter